jgi:hypothetical protein
MAQAPEARNPRRWETAVAQLCKGISGRSTRDPYNGNTRTPWSGGKGVNGHGGPFLAANACMTYSRMHARKKRIFILTGCRVSGHSQKSKAVNKVASWH